MKFRAARHTAQLQPLITFYTEIIGLKVLGSFQNHDNYDGVFLGPENANWHLEFTSSGDAPAHQPDEDDLWVFYVDDIVTQREIAKRCAMHKIPIVPAKNPYWNKGAITIVDPDGYHVLVAITDGL